VLVDEAMPTHHETGTDTDSAAADELPPDSQFESFYDQDSGAWTLRRIPSSPPTCAAEDDENDGFSR
jgi:hypothetical protein